MQAGSFGLGKASSWLLQGAGAGLSAAGMSESHLRTESIFKLAWPIYLQNATHSVVVLVDFWFFSYLSDEVAGVVGQMLPIFWVGAFVIPVFAGTGVSVASQFMGAGKTEKVVPTYMMNLLLTSTLGLVFSMVLWLKADKIGLWLGMTVEQSAIGGAYFGAICWYFVAMSGLVAYNAILSSRGLTHWLMYSSFMVALVNVGCNSLFVFGFGMGVEGVAWASVIACACALSLSVYLTHRRLGIRFYLKGVRKDMMGVLRPMARLGVSNALEPFSYTVQQIVLSTFVVAMGVASMASNSYAGRSQMFQITFAFSLASAGQILMAHWAGAKRHLEVDRLFWKVIGIAMSVALAYSLLLWGFSDTALSIFTSDPEILALGKSLLLVSIFLEPARAVNIIGGYALRTVGDARFPVVVGMLFIWGILPVIFALDRIWGLTLVGLWVCFAVDEIVRAGINLWRWKTGKWKAMGYA